MKKAAARRMADKMRKVGFAARADRMQMCGELLAGEYCPDCGKLHITRTQLCRDRVCPICTWRLSMKRYSNMVSIMQGLRDAYPEAAWQFVTLTAKNCSVDALSATIDEMGRAWNTIASRKTFKRRVAGWARALEVTYNETAHTVHPHFHVLLMWQEGMEPDEDFLPGAWMETVALTTARAAQDAQIIHSKKDMEEDPVSAAVLETYKYSVKSSDLEEMPLRFFKQTVTALRGRRLVAFGGKVKEYARRCELDDMDDLEEMDGGVRKTCIRCNSAAIHKICAQWAGTGYRWMRRD
jgi:plasmid rolling circle replication initiator protein Rep